MIIVISLPKEDCDKLCQSVLALIINFLKLRVEVSSVREASDDQLSKFELFCRGACHYYECNHKSNTFSAIQAAVKGTNTFSN